MVFYYSNRKVTGVSQDLSGEGGGQYWGKKEEDIYISYFSVTVIKHYDFIEGSVDLDQLTIFQWQVSKGAGWGRDNKEDKKVVTRSKMKAYTKQVY